MKRAIERIREWWLVFRYSRVKRWQWKPKAEKVSWLKAFDTVSSTGDIRGSDRMPVSDPTCDEWASLQRGAMSSGPIWSPTADSLEGKK